jgi:hypothetical protein
VYVASLIISENFNWSLSANRQSGDTEYLDLAEVVICIKANSNLGGIPTTDFASICDLQLA